MSLPARERRCLTGIEAELDRSDPRLVSLFATFSRLTRQEEMPPLERLRVRVDYATQRGRRMRKAALSRLRLIIIAPVAMVATCLALLIGGWSSGPSPCKVRPAASHSLHPSPSALLQPRLCPPQGLRAGAVGR